MLILNRFSSYFIQVEITPLAVNTSLRVKFLNSLCGSQYIQFTLMIHTVVVVKCTEKITVVLSLRHHDKNVYILPQ